jgi:hypothetical protein
MLRLLDYTFQFTEPRNIHHGPGNRPITKGREKVGAARQDLASGAGQHVNRLVERVGPEIQEMSLERKN